MYAHALGLPRQTTCLTLGLMGMRKGKENLRLSQWKLVALTSFPLKESRKSAEEQSSLFFSISLFGSMWSGTVELYFLNCINRYIEMPI